MILHTHLLFWHDGQLERVLPQCYGAKPHMTLEGAQEDLSELAQAMLDNPPTSCSLTGNAIEGYTVTAEWDGDCGHQHSMRCDLFIDNVKCDVESIRARAEGLGHASEPRDSGRPAQYLHTHHRLTIGGQHAATSGSCGQVPDGVDPSMLLQAQVKITQTAGEVAFDNPTVFVSGNDIEGYVYQVDYRENGRAESVTTHIFLSSESCNPESVHMGYKALDAIS